MPKGITNLEKLFYLQNRFKRSPNVKTSSSTLSYEVFNLGTTEDPKNVNIGKDCSEMENKAYIKLFITYKDIFTSEKFIISLYNNKITYTDIYQLF
jgi:hypothetical protein